MSLPSPAEGQAYCDVSALEGGFVDLELSHFTTSIEAGVVVSAPSLCFLLQHSVTGKKFVFDLGIRKNWETYPSYTVKLIKEKFPVAVPEDVVEALAKGGTSPNEISTVCFSHIHFDHIGDTSLFPLSNFVLGMNTMSMIVPGYPENPDPVVIRDIPLERAEFLSESANWQPLGPFPRALDFYGDGSIYIIDAPGHLTGHINILARTSADGAWIYLAGDSAHHWDLVTGKGEIAVHAGRGFFGCAYAQKELAEEHLLRVRKVHETPRAKVLLAHDIPWYEKNKGGPAFWPGKIPSL